jgi:hypothetical protein
MLTYVGMRKYMVGNLAMVGYLDKGVFVRVATFNICIFLMWKLFNVINYYIMYIY